MRRLAATVCLALLPLVGTGCSLFNRRPPVAPVDTSPLGPTPEAASLVGYMNRNAALVQSIQADDVDITGESDGKGTPRLGGKMVCQKPRDFRLTASFMGVSQVDFGSNNEQFWFWIKQASPNLFHCSYEEFSRGVSMPFPFQPEWVVQALGMAEYGSPENFKVDVRENRYFELSEPTQGADGRPLTRVTVFNARNVNPGESQVKGYYLRDAGGAILCSAVIKEAGVAESPTGGRIVYPKRIALEWPPEKVKMELNLDRVRVNGAASQALFTRPRWNNVPLYDLAKGPPAGRTSSRIQAAGGVVR